MVGRKKGRVGLVRVAGTGGSRKRGNVTGSEQRNMGAEAEADVALGFLGLRKRDFRGKETPFLEPAVRGCV